MFRDTVEILATTTFRSVDRKKQDILAAGERCIRFFSDAELIYVKRLGKDSGFGWTSLAARGEGKSWKVTHLAWAQTVLSPLIVNRMTQRIREVNLTLSKIYTNLGQESGKRFLPPQWRIDSTTTLPTYIYEPATAARFYARSIKELNAVLQTYLLGTGFDAVRADNRIEIKRH
ncbi:MAG: hypothetical protein HYY49_00620 [Ignavibacteriales bacterium]|nr:hypothetical protein [Ignavibacteriales bacterium]